VRLSLGVIDDAGLSFAADPHRGGSPAVEVERALTAEADEDASQLLTGHARSVALRASIDGDQVDPTIGRNAHRRARVPFVEVPDLRADIHRAFLDEKWSGGQGVSALGERRRFAASDADATLGANEQGASHLLIGRVELLAVDT
jgi:hypothetical protein